MKSWSKKTITALNVLLIITFGVLLFIHFVSPISFTMFGEKISATDYSNPLILITMLWIARQLIVVLTRPRIADDKMTWYYLGISIIAGATLLLEVTMTRIFSVAFFNHYAFLIISTALFGMGFSGVVLSIFPSLSRWNFDKLLTAFSICFGVTTIATLKIIVAVPLQFSSMKDNPIQYLYLAIYYLAMATPFFCSGLVISLLLSHIPLKVNKLYFSDLIGAGIGCFLIMPLVPKLGASGTVMIAALLGILASMCFGKSLGKSALIVSIVFMIAIAALLPLRETVFRVTIHENKRSFNVHEQAGQIEFSKWGPISRIDVAALGMDKIIWIDGGSNQGFMKPFDGNVNALEPSPLAGLVYNLVDKPDVLIVGPAGGEEVLYALSHRPNSITGVELDPVIVHIVQNEYRDFIGGIFNQPNVKLVNDEGRSYIRRSAQQFDVIQQINNASPVAIASGAVNVSETYLITVEAFHDYLNHLKPGGYVFIRRWGALRLAQVAIQALRERGVEHPEEQIIILYDALHPFGGGQFFLKNGTFTEQELNVFRHEKVFPNVMYGPKALQVAHPQYQEYVDLLTQPDGAKKYYAKTGIDMSPVVDDRPFFNHFTKFGQFNLDNVPEEFKTFLKNYRSSDSSLLIILGEAAVLSLMFILLPLYVFKRASLNVPGKIRLLLYFCSLGLAFILIEIAFIQKFTLFMGNPTYSVSVVLFSILVAAGCGSFLSEKFHRSPQKALMVVIPGIGVVCWILLTLSPIIFKACLGYSMPIRVIISIVMIAPLALLMGMPFPLGITVVNRVSQRLIPWVWGINGYSTVVGSVLCVILALSFGFKIVIGAACVIYIGGLLAISTIKA